MALHHVSKLLSGIDCASRLAETTAVALIYGYCVLMLAEVVARSQAQSLAYSWEYSQYAMAAIFALAAGPAIRSGTHVRISLVTDYLPTNVQRWADLLANTVAIVIALIMAWAMWVKTGQAFERNIVATTVTKTPLWIPQALLLWGLVQLVLDLTARLIRRARNTQCEWRDASAEPDVESAGG